MSLPSGVHEAVNAFNRDLSTMITTAADCAYVRLTLLPDRDAAAAGRISSKLAMRIGVSRLTTPVHAKIEAQRNEAGIDAVVRVASGEHEEQGDHDAGDQSGEDAGRRHSA